MHFPWSFSVKETYQLALQLVQVLVHVRVVVAIDAVVIGAVAAP